jgi:hypothetical protein
MTEREECGCEPNEMCTTCTPIEEFTEALRAALSAQIRGDEVPDAERDEPGPGYWEVGDL